MTRQKMIEAHALLCDLRGLFYDIENLSWDLRYKANHGKETEVLSKCREAAAKLQQAIDLIETDDRGEKE